MTTQQGEGDERRPIGELLPGLGIHPLEEGDVPVEAFVLVKTRDSSGVTGWGYRTTAPPNKEELLGALVCRSS